MYFLIYIFECLCLLSLQNSCFYNLAKNIKKNIFKMQLNKLSISHFCIFGLILFAIKFLFISFIQNYYYNFLFQSHYLHFIVKIILVFVKIVILVVMLYTLNDIPSHNLFFLSSNLLSSHRSLSSFLNLDIDLDVQDRSRNPAKCSSLIRFKIDPVQRLKKKHQFYHSIEVRFRQTRLDKRRFDSISEKPRRKALVSPHSSLNLSLKEPIRWNSVIPVKYFKLSRTESQLRELAVALEQFTSAPADQDLAAFKVTDLEETVNGFLNANVSEAQSDFDDIQKAQHLILCFFRLQREIQLNPIWIQHLFLLFEFPSAFSLTPSSTGHIFPQFEVARVRRQPSGEFHLRIDVKKQRRSISLNKSVAEIQRLVSLTFDFLVFDLRADDPRIRRQFVYLLNVCLNDLSQSQYVFEFLEYLVQPIEWPYRDPVKIEFRLEMFECDCYNENYYEIWMTESGRPELAPVKIKRSLEHFRVVSRNLNMRFGFKFLFELKSFSESEAVKRWLESVSSNPLTAYYPEWLLFLDHFQIRS